MVDHKNQEQSILLHQLVGQLYELIKSNLDNSKFSELDAMMISILMQRHSNADEEHVAEWIEKCRQEHRELLKKSSSALIKRVLKSFQYALMQSVTVVNANNVTINKNYPK
jgi:hypothetical protein